VHYSWTEPESKARKDAVLKLLSQDPASYRDAPTEGIRRVLELVTGEAHSRHKPLPIDQLGTYPSLYHIADNASCRSSVHHRRYQRSARA
jgi:5-oxoprolinase (ATP-hydrolysing)